MHRAGTPESLETANWIAQQFRNFGLDNVEQPQYDVLLSYPNNADPNKVGFECFGSFGFIFLRTKSHDDKNFRNLQLTFGLF